MCKSRLISLLLLFFLIHPVYLFPDEGKSRQGENPETLPLNRDFYLKFTQFHPINRDDYLESTLNKIVICRGKIKSIDKSDRYRRKYRIQCVDRDAEQLNLTVVYYVFVDNKDSIAMLAVDSIFEFNGQLAAYTPLNSLRNSYIFDIILEKGAIVIE